MSTPARKVRSCMRLAAIAIVHVVSLPHEQVQGTHPNSLDQSLKINITHLPQNVTVMTSDSVVCSASCVTSRGCRMTHPRALMAHPTPTTSCCGMQSSLGQRTPRGTEVTSSYALATVPVLWTAFERGVLRMQVPSSSPLSSLRSTPTRRPS